ncbi:MAG TPA: hypothetical protein VJ385_00140 [Fibrobacteria bacterium]|nr:hypothetical protein [Fibrobacteria bacterium]
MEIKASVLVFALTCALAPAQTAREYRAGNGLVRVMALAGGDGREAACAAAGFESALMDSSEERGSVPAPEDDADALFEFYLLDKATGSELRFPAKCSQVNAFLRERASAYRTGTLDERAVAVVGDLSASLRVRMMSPGRGGGK